VRPEGSGGSSGTGYAAAAAAAAGYDALGDGALPSAEWERAAQEQQYSGYARYLQTYRQQGAPHYQGQQLSDWRQQQCAAPCGNAPALSQAASWPASNPAAADGAAGGGGRAAVSMPGHSRLHRLPGDGSEAVAAMADFLAGLSAAPPLHLLQHASIPSFGGRALDLRALFSAVVERGGYCQVTRAGRWGEVLWALGLQEGPLLDTSVFKEIHTAYLQLLLRFERMYDTEAWLLLTGRPVSGGHRRARAGGAGPTSRDSAGRRDGCDPLPHRAVLTRCRCPPQTLPPQSPILGVPRANLAASGSFPADGMCPQARGSPSASSSGGNPGGSGTRLGVRASAPCVPTPPLERPAKRRSCDIEGSSGMMRHSSFSGASAFTTGVQGRSVTTNIAAGEDTARGAG
jgi:hypothetical protein